MRKTLVAMSLLFVVLLLSACASGTAYTWKESDTNGIKGMSSEQVTKKFGEPDRKYKSQGKQVFEYRKPAEKESGKNAYVAITSFGFASGKDSMYVDILKIVFNNGRVVDYSYEESAMGIALPGGMTPSN